MDNVTRDGRVFLKDPSTDSTSYKKPIGVQIDKRDLDKLIKGNKVGISISNSDDDITEADNEKTFEVEYTVTYKKNMKGTSAGDVQNQIKNNNAGNQVSVRYAREVAPIEENLSESAGENNVFAKKYAYGTEPYDIVVAVNSIGSIVNDYNKEHWKVIKDALSKYIRQNYNESKEDEKKITEDFGDESKDQSVMITSTKEVEDDLTEDLEKDVAMDNEISAELSDNHRAFFSLINDLIIGELDTINAYNGAIVTAKDLGLESASKLIQDISDEETRHIGELQHLMKTITPQAQEIPNGENEATEKMQDFEDGVDDSVDGAIGASSPLWKQTNAIVLDNVDDDIMGIESYL